ncbi:glycosyltransferase, partial [Candidatus Woesearchaeota archaeon]|nr:glycosyltransferase [Candidatus Woesearchaeota archaeon]
LAKRILDYDPNYKFIVVGSGDMEGKIIEKAAELDLADKIIFTGFLRGSELDQIYQMADLYVIPSISEPLGITPLEAMRNNTPCLISKQSGVSEVLHHCLKADFWDINKMADQIISILKYPEGYHHLKENTAQEIKKFNWDEPAQKCLSLYKKWVK